MTPDEAEACREYLGEARKSPRRWARLVGTTSVEQGERIWVQLSAIEKADPQGLARWIDDYCCEAGRRRVWSAVRQKRFTNSFPLVTTKLTSETHGDLVRLAVENGLTLDETVSRLVQAAAKVPAVARELSHVSTK